MFSSSLPGTAEKHPSPLRTQCPLWRTKADVMRTCRAGGGGSTRAHNANTARRRDSNAQHHQHTHFIHFIVYAFGDAVADDMTTTKPHNIPLLGIVRAMSGVRIHNYNATRARALSIYENNMLLAISLSLGLCGSIMHLRLRACFLCVM